MEYTELPGADDTIFTVEEFRQDCADRSLIDYDGFGCPMRDGRLCPYVSVYPSEVDKLPPDATHVVWYNR